MDSAAVYALLLQIISAYYHLQFGNKWLSFILCITDV